MMRANLKPAIISAVVVAILAGLLLGIRLNQQGTTLSLVGAGPDVYWKIGAAAAFLFFFNLFPLTFLNFHGTKKWLLISCQSCY